MAKPINNPFYFVLLAACLALLVTMLIYLMGFWYVPNPDGPTLPGSLPPLLKWVDRNALLLIAGEVTAIILLSILTIGLDRYFDRGAANEPPNPPSQ